MLSYDKWKLLNESLGSTVLGLGQRQSLGLVSNIPTLQEKSCEMGEYDDAEEDDEEDDSEGEYEVDLEDYDDPDANVEEVEEEDDEVEDDEEGEDDEEEDDDDDDDDDEDYGDEDEDEDEEEEYVDDEEEKMSTDPETEEDLEVDDSDDGMSAMMQLKALKPESTKVAGKDLKEVEWWKSVSSMIGTMTPSGNIVFEANKNKVVKEEEVEVEVKEKEEPKMGNVAQTAMSRLERYLTGNKLRNISAKNIQTLLRALLSHILENNDKSQAALLRKTFLDALKSYVAGK
jgi:hypothetical protein